MTLTPWLQFGGSALHLEELPSLLERSGLLVPLFRRLILESCIQNIKVSREEQVSFQQRFLTENGLDDAEKLNTWLAKRSLTEEKASSNLLEALKLDNFKKQKFAADIERIFLDSKEQRDRIVYSLLRVKDKAAAIELHLRLEEGDATFTDLSQEHSVGPERETGGLIGPVPMGRLHPKLAELLRISKPGQLWKPMQIDGWWVIVRLDKVLPAQLDSTMEQKIRDECFENWMQEQIDQFMAAYRQAQQQQHPPSTSQATPD